MTSWKNYLSDWWIVRSCLSTWPIQMCPNHEHVKCVTWTVQMVEHFCFCIVSMAEHKQFNYLYLGKLGQLANPTKKNFGKPKMTLSWPHLDQARYVRHRSIRDRGSCRENVLLLKISHFEKSISLLLSHGAIMFLIWV